MYLAKIANIATIIGVLINVYLLVGGVKAIRVSIEGTMTYIIYIVLGLTLISAFLGLYWSFSAKSKIVKFPKKIKFSKVSDKVFVNEKVYLDGCEFNHCEFRSVTLHWNGVRPFHMINSSFYTPVVLSTDSHIVSGTVYLLKALGYMKENIPLVTGDQRTPIEPGITRMS